jgi:hypothetical protein
METKTIPVTYNGHVVGEWLNGNVVFNDTNESKDLQYEFLAKQTKPSLTNKCISMGKDDKVSKIELMSTNNAPVGPIFLPYQFVTTHTSITDKNGTRRYRNVSRWMLFKLWLYSIKHKIKTKWNTQNQK